MSAILGNPVEMEDISRNLWIVDLPDALSRYVIIKLRVRLGGRVSPGQAMEPTGIPWDIRIALVEREWVRKGWVGKDE
jgi:hypothetical protein